MIILEWYEARQTTQVVAARRVLAFGHLRDALAVAVALALGIDSVVGSRIDFWIVAVAVASTAQIISQAQINSALEATIRRTTSCNLRNAGIADTSDLLNSLHAAKVG